MGIHGDPEGIFALANRILGEPAGYMRRAHTTIQGNCTLDAGAFGAMPGAFIGPAYTSAQNTFAGSTGQAADLIHNLAAGIANVANDYGAAENANMLTTPDITLSPNHLSDEPLSGDAAGEMATEVTFWGEWFLTGLFFTVHGILEACGTLTPAAIVASVTYLLVQPDDQKISNAINGWGAAKNDVNMSKTTLDTALGAPLDAVWLPTDGARPAFDTWKDTFDADLDMLKDAIDKMPDKFQDMLQELKTIHLDLFVAACASLAVMIALTSIDWLFGAGQAAKAVEAIGLQISVYATVLLILGVIGTFLGYMIDLSSKAGGFDVNQPGNQIMPHFEDATITWDRNIHP